MLPAEEFDDPKSLGERLTLLRSVGASPGAFKGVSGLKFQPRDGASGRSARATLFVPTEAPFFADHFPRRPVLPGTLLMQANLQAAALLASQVTCGTPWRPRIISEVKLRTFIEPGQTVELEARLADRSDLSLSVMVESRLSHRLVGSAAIEFSPELPS